jgi:lysophospholipase L1-like esterase
VQPEFNYLWENNSLGMRDPERKLEKDAETFRVLFLGDSFVQGYGVPREQSMVALLEQNLNQPPRSKTIEVLNGGVFGYSPFLEYLYLRELMPKLKPDLVLLALFLGNDVGDDNFYTGDAHYNSSDGSFSFETNRWPWTALDQAIEKEKPSAPTQTPPANQSVPASTGPHLWRLIKWCLNKSRLFRTIGDVWDDWRERQESYAQTKARNDFLDAHRDDIRYNLAAVNYPAAEPRRRLEYWQPTKLYLTQIHQLCAAQHTPLVLIVIPGAKISQATSFPEPYQILDQLGEELSTPVIQLLPSFRTLRYDEMKFKVDGHWNAKGHRAAATILNRELRKLDVLPPQKRAR